MKKSFLTGKTGDFLTEVLCAPRADRIFRKWAAEGGLKEILPEIEAMRGVTQPPEFHPEGDVFEHTMIMLKHMVFPDPLLAWSVLLHDVGKPLTRSVEESGRIRFFGHEEKGAEMVPSILKRFGFQEKEIAIIVHAVKNHMRFAYVRDMRDGKLTRLIREEHFSLELELHRLDCISCHGKMACFDFLVEKMLELPAVETEIKPFVSGADLLALGMVPGRKMGELLKKVRQMQCAGGIPSREKALEFVKQTINKG